MAGFPLEADSARHNVAGSVNRSLLPNDQRMIVHDLVIQMEELSGHIESLAALIGLVARIPDWDGMERDGLDALHEHAGTIAQRAAAFSERFGSAFGYDAAPTSTEHREVGEAA